MNIKVGNVEIIPQVREGMLESIGEVLIAGKIVRNSSIRFLPWFDSYEGDIFSRFEFLGVEEADDRVVLHTRAVSSNDFPFREKRDSSGDLCFRNVSWDSPPSEALFDIVFQNVSEEIDGRSFQGFRYWFEYQGEVEIHRLLDRATWEVGGKLEDHVINMRNWMTPPYVELKKETAFSTVGPMDWRGPMPGNLWARWSLLSGFELTYSPTQGILVGKYDQVSLIRTVIESVENEDTLRVMDLHLFEQAKEFKTNPKSILFHPDSLDRIDAANLWTRLTDSDRNMSQNQFGIKNDGPPKIEYAKNAWVGMTFDETYEDVIDRASELGAELVFIDPIWEDCESFEREIKGLIPDENERKKTLAGRMSGGSMCCVMDFTVSEQMGGEERLKALCDRAKDKGVEILSWVAAHMTPLSPMRFWEGKELGAGEMGVYATKESTRHPDTGYAGDCWALNLNAPIQEYLKNQVLGICERTGLKGFLWDSFSNLGWWQIEYANNMRPQFERMADLYTTWSNAGLYLMPEGVTAFSNHNCLDQFGGEVYKDENIVFAYNSCIGMGREKEGLGKRDEEILKGNAPIDMLFKAFANKWIPNSDMWKVPKQDWDEDNVEEIKRLYTVYKKVRDRMIKRIILKNDLGVLWEDENGPSVIFSFKDQDRKGRFIEVISGEQGGLSKNRVYLVENWLE